SLVAAPCLMFIVSGCGGSQAEAPAEAPAPAEDTASTESRDQELYDLLPDKVKEAGVLRVVTLGSYPPYTLNDGAEHTGISIDFIDAYAELVGLDVEYTAVSGSGPLVTSLQSGRFDFSTNHLADSV